MLRYTGAVPVAIYYTIPKIKRITVQYTQCTGMYVNKFIIKPHTAAMAIVFRFPYFLFIAGIIMAPNIHPLINAMLKNDDTRFVISNSLIETI